MDSSEDTRSEAGSEAEAAGERRGRHRRGRRHGRRRAGGRGRGQADQHATRRRRSLTPLDPTQRLRIGYLLTLVGGSMDAYTFFARGGVFANAQTGNIILMSVSVVEADLGRFLSYFVPIVAFILGLLAVLYLERLLARKEKRLARRYYLAIEIAVLGVVALLPATPTFNPLANALVSFVAAMQYEAFKSFSGMAFTTTMTTGNLRKFVDSLFEARKDDKPEARTSWHVFGLAILMFILGALMGAQSGKVLGQFGCVPTMALLGLAIAIITIDKRPR